jgi:hypothetical protein
VKVNASEQNARKIQRTCRAISLTSERYPWKTPRQPLLTITPGKPRVLFSLKIWHKYSSISPNATSILEPKNECLLEQVQVLDGNEIATSGP